MFVREAFSFCTRPSRCGAQCAFWHSTFSIRRGGVLAIYRFEVVLCGGAGGGAGGGGGDG